MMMVFEGIVRNGAVELPPEADLPEGSIVRVETTPLKRFNDLADLAGTWGGDDADRVVAEIYAQRSSAPPRAPLSQDPRSGMPKTQPVERPRST